MEREREIPLNGHAGVAENSLPTSCPDCMSPGTLYSLAPGFLLTALQWPAGLHGESPFFPILSYFAD